MPSSRAPRRPPPRSPAAARFRTTTRAPRSSSAKPSWSQPSTRISGKGQSLMLAQPAPAATRRSRPSPQGGGGSNSGFRVSNFVPFPLSPRNLLQYQSIRPRAQHSDHHRHQNHRHRQNCKYRWHSMHQYGPNQNRAKRRAQPAPAVGKSHSRRSQPRRKHFRVIRVKRRRKPIIRQSQKRPKSHHRQRRHRIPKSQPQSGHKQSQDNNRPLPFHPVRSPRRQKRPHRRNHRNQQGVLKRMQKRNSPLQQKRRRPIRKPIKPNRLQSLKNNKHHRPRKIRRPPQLPKRSVLGLRHS